MGADLADLDRIVKETIAAIERSREQIYEIAEGARQEYQTVEAELQEVKDQVNAHIALVDHLTRAEKVARQRLLHVSRNFSQYGEQDIREAYERAWELQVELRVAQEQEKQLRRRRDELERRLRRLKETVRRAEELVSRVGVAMGYLAGNLKKLAAHMDDLRQRRWLAAAVIKAQEEERRRVAREIHDGPAQALANLAMRLEVCQRMLEQQPQDVKEELKDLAELSRASLAEVRKIIFDLRPMALDDLGLTAALRAYINGLQEKTGLQVELVVLGPEVPLDSALEVNAFRLVQEALSNVVKHAGVDRAWVRVETTRSQLNLVVEDEGVGFNVKEVMSSPNGFGLMGMRERVEMFGGKFHVRSAPGQGTRVQISLPLEGAEEQVGGR